MAISSSIPYTIRFSTRARRMGATVYPGGEVVVTVPHRITTIGVEQFMRRHARWLDRAVARLGRARSRTRLPGGKRDYAANRESARALVHARLTHFNQIYGFSYGRVSIKDVRSRWGSCSRKGNLNFSYKLVHLPPEIADYVIVHELCHLAHFNHSREFWQLVARAIPDYAARRKRLGVFSH